MINNLIKKFGIGIATAGMAISSMAMPAMAASVTFEPWTYDPGNLCNESAVMENATTVTLSKPCVTATEAAAGVELSGVSGLSTTGLTLSFDYEGYCGAGAPRFNVYLSNGSTVFLGCSHGDPANLGTATFTAGQTYGGVLFPEGETITGIEMVQDEEGTVIVSNIKVNDMTAVFPLTPGSKEQCKKDGYKNFTDSDGKYFKNQGQCVSYFNTL